MTVELGWGRELKPYSAQLPFVQESLSYISNNFLGTFRNINVIFNSLKLILNDGFGEETHIPIKADWL